MRDREGEAIVRIVSAACTAGCGTEIRGELLALSDATARAGLRVLAGVQGWGTAPGEMLCPTCKKREAREQRAAGT